MEWYSTIIKFPEAYPDLQMGTNGVEVAVRILEPMHVVQARLDALRERNKISRLALDQSQNNPQV